MCKALFFATILAIVSVAIVANCDTRTCSYDFGNRLIRVERPDGTVTTYTYDDQGNRLTSGEINTPAGNNVQVQPSPGTSVTFGQVSAPGQTTVTVEPTPPPAPQGFNVLGQCYDVSTTATCSGPVQTCFTYSDAGLSPSQEANVKVLHWEGSWVDRTCALDTAANQVCGCVSQLSPFVVAVPAGNLPPFAPSNATPADGAPGIRLSAPVLSWSGGDPDPGDTVTYDLYFGRLNPPPLKQGGLAVATLTLGKLFSYTTYYWRVVARDSHGATTAGPVWSFTTTDQGCPVITSLSPNPAQPAATVTISGRGFGSTKGLILIGKLIYKPRDRRIISWSDTRIVFKLPAYAAWSSGTTQTKNVRIKAGPVGSRIVSNWVPLTITKQ